MMTIILSKLADHDTDRGVKQRKSPFSHLRRLSGFLFADKSFEISNLDLLKDITRQVDFLITYEYIG